MKFSYFCRWIVVAVASIYIAGCPGLGGGGGGGGGSVATYTLAVTKTGCGTGTVTSSPGGVSCGADCSEDYDSGASVTLTATPDASFTFEGWSGAGCSGTGNCVVTVSAATSVSAEFGKIDPLYIDQWHLKNTGQGGGVLNEDIDVEPVWASGIRGTGVRVAVVDDGLEIAHEDLAPNVVPNKSHDYVGGGTNPTGGEHGTSVAGLVAARGGNCLGVSGVAPRGEMVGYNLLQASISTNEADAMTRDRVDNHVSSNSWGAADNRGTLDASSLLWRSAINTGLSEGRGGLGTIYTWAAGNGHPRDNSNYDGRANYRGVIAVAAVTDSGTKSSYSEQGANLWISAPGGEFCSTHTLSTTDRSANAGYNTAATAGATDYVNQNYTKCFNGTSSATPVISGAISLMLEANPNLGWRDVRLILAETARKNDAGDADWKSTTAPYNFNHNYGFGVVDADAAVTRAKTWTNVGPEKTYTTSLSMPTDGAIPDNNLTGISDTITVSNSGIGSIEWVEITFTSDHTYSGDLELILTSPAGAVSLLSKQHTCGPCSTYSGWVMGSARHLGEGADGDWRLRVRDTDVGVTGNFQSWKLKFYGTAGTVVACDATQTAGGDTADTRQVELGKTAGTFDFKYQTYSIKDQMKVTYEGGVLLDTGCVGESKTIPLTYSGSSTKVTVEVIPNCAGTSGTAWYYTVYCP
ncbi:MAG: hypothetical protein BMS9Abin36_0906 [Gammaproteobacteria bacterium]|nr:MAG: hypothetical protein BMS9Abin36_0906 [Gammaproteobacteria bacterium]